MSTALSIAFLVSAGAAEAQRDIQPGAKFRGAYPAFEETVLPWLVYADSQTVSAARTSFTQGYLEVGQSNTRPMNQDNIVQPRPDIFYVSLTSDLIGTYIKYRAESEEAVRAYVVRSYVKSSHASNAYGLPWCSVYSERDYMNMRSKHPEFEYNVIDRTFAKLLRSDF